VALSRALRPVVVDNHLDPEESGLSSPPVL